jgi:hypothetical protein
MTTSVNHAKYVPIAAFLAIVSIAQSAQAAQRCGPITDDAGRVRSIVVLRDGATKGFPTAAPRDDRFGGYHKVQARKLIADLERSHGVTAQGMTSWVNTSFTAYLTQGQMDSLSRDPRVERISPDAWVQFSSDPGSVWTDSGLGSGEISSWGRNAVNPNSRASAGTVIVYVIDGGVDAHPDDLNVIQWVNAINTAYTDLPHLVSCYEHPTHVAGIIGAFNNGTGAIGIDPGVQIISVSVLDPTTSNGSCLPAVINGSAVPIPASYIHRAIDWVYQDIATRPGHHVGIINISANGVGFDVAGGGEAAIAMQRVATPTPGYAGAFVVQSAGNQFSDACAHAYNATASNDGIMVVGAINDHGQPVTPLNGVKAFRNSPLAGNEDGSNYGGCVEAWAPGNAILSTWASGGVALLSGTSMAAPHIAGLGAWLAETQGLSTPAQIEAAVRATLYPLQTTDHSGAPVNLASVSPSRPASTPYGELRIGETGFLSPFSNPPPPTVDPPPDGPHVVYSDQPYSLSFDSLGSGSAACDLDFTQNGSTQRYLPQNVAQYYAPTIFATQNMAFSSASCPPANASVTFRPAPIPHWLVNGTDMTNNTLNWPPGTVLSFTSQNAAQCQVIKGLLGQGGYAPIETDNLGQSATVSVIQQTGNWQYFVRCTDAFGISRNAWIYLNVAVPPPMPVSGMWWNPSRSGNGWSITMNDYGTLLFYWFTFTPWGSPTWYYGTANVSGSSYAGQIYSTTWNGSSATASYRGQFALSLSSSTQGSIAWNLGSISGTEPVQYQAFGGAGSAPRLTGSWYPPSQSGWGIEMDVEGNRMAAEITAYDGGGQPIWFYGDGDVSTSIYVNLVTFNGTNLCPGCTGITSLSETYAGWMQVNPDPSQNSGTLSTVVYPDPQWNCTGLPISRLTH